MTLADELRSAAQTRPPRLACGVAVWLAALPDKDRDDVAAILMDGASNLAAVARHLRATDDSAPPDSTLMRHRRGLCSCGRS